MPTSKPRITITFPEHLKATIDRFAELQGRSFGAVVVDILETVHEPLMRTVAILDAAREAPAEVRRGLRQVFDEVERDVVSSGGSALAQMDWLLHRLREEPEGASEGRKGGSNPRPGNTGVRSGSDGGQKGARSPVKGARHG